MPFSLARVTQSPRLGQCFTVTRTTGVFAAGGWQVTGVESLQFFGVLGIADDEALSMVPEGDRVTGSLVVYTDQPIYPTKAAAGTISDKVEWDGSTYRVTSRAPWGHYGYWGAVLVRMSGD